MAIELKPLIKIHSTTTNIFELMARILFIKLIIQINTGLVGP